jgi:hypothetical protein
MSDLSNLFSDFNKANIINWLRETGTFFRSPRTYVTNLAAKAPEDLLPQFVFYFVVYTFSYIFFSSASDFATLIKPAIFSVTFAIPTIFIFTLSSFIITKTNYFKSTAIFVMSAILFVGPAIMIIYAVFLGTEDYTYLLLGNIGNSLLILFCVFFYGFALSNDRKIAWKISLFNYAFLSLLYLVFIVVNFDKDAAGPVTVHDDLILSEYRSIVEPLKEKERTPNARIITVFYDKIYSDVTIGNMIKDHQFTGSTDSNKIYRKNIALNLTTLNNKLKDIKFRRNRQAVLLWIKYYNAVAEQYDFKYHDTTQVFHDRDLHLLKIDSGGRIRLYSSGVRLDSIVATQMQLKAYHNNLIRVASLSDDPAFISDIIVFFPGKIIEGIYFQLFIDGVKHVYKEQFHPFE